MKKKKNLRTKMPKSPTVRESTKSQGDRRLLNVKFAEDVEEIQKVPVEHLNSKIQNALSNVKEGNIVYFGYTEDSTVDNIRKRRPTSWMDLGHGIVNFHKFQRLADYIEQSKVEKEQMLQETEKRKIQAMLEDSRKRKASSELRRR